MLNSHMNFRMSYQDKQIIETAAKLKGLKPNTYARQKLLESAERDIAELNQLNTLVLSEKDWDQFVILMEAPIKLNKNLARTAKKFKKTFG